MIILDRFPSDCAIWSSDGVPHNFEGTRVVLTENHILVAIDGEEAASVLFFEKYTKTDLAYHPDVDSVVHTESGKMVVFRKNDECGCGSRLRGWNAYKTLERLVA